MSFSDIWGMCVENLKRRKGRTFLTVFGVFIGCTLIVVMISIGIGMKELQDKMLSEMGDLTVIQVSSPQVGMDNAGIVSSGQGGNLDDDTVESFKKIPGVVVVMPQMSMDEYSVSLSTGINDRYRCEWATIVGIDMSAMEEMGYEIIMGDFPGPAIDEVIGGEYFAYSFTDTLMPEGRNMIDRWAVKGEAANAAELPDPLFDPVNSEITLEVKSHENENEVVYKNKVKVKGLTKEDSGKGWENADGMMMSIDALKDLISKVKGDPVTKVNYTTITVKTADIKQVSRVEKAISAMGYSTYSIQSMRARMEKNARQVQLMLGGLGAISLIVAVIGITNTMIMSISERTREIGIMKALGCFARDIRALFLIEAGTIGLIGVLQAV